MGAQKICEALRHQILNGIYPAGSLLPSSRGLATEMGVSRTTITVAYEQLAAEGFIEVRQGARPRAADLRTGQETARRRETKDGAPRLSPFGERLRATQPWHDHPPDEPRLDFRYGDLASADFPLRLWKRAMNDALSRRPLRLRYDDPRGALRLRKALQAYLWRARGLHCETEQIIVVNGSQQGLDLCARILLAAGDRFVIEDPCYRMARQVFAATGAIPIPIPADSAGMRTELLEGVAARMAYVTPSHQFPLGGIMPIARRHQLLDWADRNRAFLVEDDYDSEYRYDIGPVPPLQSLAAGNAVIYSGTVSKTLSPLLRIGYLVVPRVLQDIFATAKQYADRHTTSAEQEALASLIESGSYDRHVRRMRRLNAERRTVLLACLEREFGRSVTVEGADAGLHVVVWFNDLPRSKQELICDAARKAGVGLHPVSPHYLAGLAPDDRLGFVLGYSALSSSQIGKGVSALKTAVIGQQD